MRIFLCLALLTVGVSLSMRLGPGNQEFEGQVDFVLGASPPAQTKTFDKKRNT